MTQQPSTLSTPKRRWRLAWQNGIRWIVTLGLLGLVGAHIELELLSSLLRNINWMLVAVAFALAFADRLLATLRWLILLRVMDVPVRFIPLLALHLTAGFIGSFLPTSFGVDAVRIIMLVRREGRGMACTAASVMDRLIMVSGSLMAAAVATLLLSASTPLHGWSVLLVSMSAGALLGAIILLHPSLVAPLTSGLRKLAGPRFGERLASFYLALHLYRHHGRALAISAALTVMMLGVRVWLIFALGLAIGVDVGFLEYLLVMPMAWVVVMLPISIGGFGLQEGAYALLMGFVGVSATAAVSISLLDHLIVRVVAFSGVLVWLVRPEFRLKPEPHPRRS